MQNQKTRAVRCSICRECGKEFVICLDEFLLKLDSGMRLPTRCKACRRTRRAQPDIYAGTRSLFGKYPATRGHRQTVHGGD